MDFGTFLRRFGANLRKARWLTGMTQEEVAAQGISYRYYQEIERGQRNPTLRTLFTLARILNTTVAALVDVEGFGKKRRRTLSGVKATPPKLGRKPKLSGRKTKK